MRHPKDIPIDEFTYLLPEDRIARHPLAERDASKLLIYKHKTIAEDVYKNIADHIPTGTLMVFNQTKVVHARLLFKKPSGGIIEVFCLAPHNQYADIQTAMTQKGSVLWECLVGGASKWKHGMALELHHYNPAFILYATIVERTTGAFILKLEWDQADLTFAEILNYAGKVPLPPYLHREAEVTDEARYQTVFAHAEGSVAAPTAGLHFTEQILYQLRQKEIATGFVTLHVGAGTFKPVKSLTMETHDMHAEWIEVTSAMINELLAHLGGPVVAVGTTSLRTLESLYWIGNKLSNGLYVDLHSIAVNQWDPYDLTTATSAAQALTALLSYMESHELDKIVTRTQILIAPGYQFRIITGLVTNFHQPQSTLLLLVAAIAGNDWKEIYSYALGHDYRFLSYGDGSLLWL
jgi:S-adenosylmethionine:tRNA ribosyltransferase-isomerase